MDALRDAEAVLRARPGRSAGLASAVAVAVALAIVTVGIAQSAAAQVSERFNAVLNTEIAVTEPGGLPADPFAPAGPAAADDALGALAGVDAAGTVSDFGTATLTVGRGDYEARVFSLTSGVPVAARLTVRWADPQHRALDRGEALVGEFAAEGAQVGPVELEPLVRLDGRELRVVGVVTASDRLADLLSGVMVGTQDLTGAPLTVHHLLLTVPGAAPQVAEQAATVLRPTDPTQLQVVAPVDPTTVRASVQGDVRLTLLVLTVVAVLAAVAGLANAMMLSVSTRTVEFGLRRALGARPRHVVTSVLVEAALLGIAGGTGGLALGLAGILGVTLAQRWVPVFDLRLAPGAVLGGLVVGGIGGLVAAARASRIQPADALRSW